MRALPRAIPPNTRSHPQPRRLERTVPVKSVASDLESTISGALGQRSRVSSIVAEAAAGGIKTLFFVGCGGSLYASSPIGDVMATRGRSVVTYRMESGEFVYGPPATLGPDSLVVVGSHTGTTPETIKAIEVARAHGPRAVLAITREPDSPLAQAADHAFTYGSKHTVWEPKQVYLAQIGHGALLACGDESQAEHDAALDAYSGLGGAILDAIAASDDYLAEMAAALASEPVIYVLGAGRPRTWPAACRCATCRRCSGCTRRRSMRTSSSTGRSRWSPTRPRCCSSSARTTPGLSPSGPGPSWKVRPPGLDGRPGRPGPARHSRRLPGRGRPAGARLARVQDRAAFRGSDRA